MSESGDIHPVAYIVPILFAIIFIVGIAGNGTLIFTVLWNKKMRNVPNIHILSLAVGDLLLILVSVPFAATLYTMPYWPFGLGLCKFNYFMQTLSLGVSVFTLTALSGDRYRVIVKPMSRHTGNPNFWTYCTVFAIWLVSILLATPDLVSASTLENFDPTNVNRSVFICQVYHPEWPEWYPQARVLTRFSIFFAIPVVVIGFFYVMMARMLLISGNLIAGESQQRQIEARKKVAKVVLTFVVIFFVCWIPRHIYLLWYYFDPNDMNEFWSAFKVIAFCLYFMNSCVNPMALYFLSRQFRKYYNEYLFCCFARLRYSAVEQSATMYNFNSTVRRTSTNTTMIHSQSMC